MTGTNPIISIIVPVYNAERYLERCIESVLAQTADKFELLLIDDGSSESSLEICKRYQIGDPRIKVYHKENGGVSSARNEVIMHAQGKYIQFLDSDDSMKPDLCATLLKTIEENRADLVVCGTKRTKGSSYSSQMR